MNRNTPAMDATSRVLSGPCVVLERHESYSKPIFMADANDCVDKFIELVRTKRWPGTEDFVGYFVVTLEEFNERQDVQRESE